MLRGAKNTVQGCKMAFGTPFLATCIGVALIFDFILVNHKSMTPRTIKSLSFHELKLVSLSIGMELILAEIFTAEPGTKTENKKKKTKFLTYTKL